MKNMLQYKGYMGSVAFDADDKILYGRVLGIRPLIGFEGTTVEDLEKDFQAGIDDYLDMCAEKGMEPEKPFKGTFNIRLDSSLHQRLVAHAADEGKTLNAFIKDTLEKAVSETHA
jgi:predicted HicB family RNase H-like nuclease